MSIIVQSVLEVNADLWESEVLHSSTLVIVDFWHDKCVWCKRLEPIFSEVSSEYESKAKFANFNVLSSQENHKLADKYGVMGTPTIIFFCEGRPVESIAGFQPKERLKAIIDGVIQNHRECIDKSTPVATS